MGITSKDWIQLSAYVDGELSRREQEILERKLQSDPRLQSALDQLKITKRVLQATPSIKVPRNFTITSKEVTAKPRRSAAVGYRLAAATMSFLLIGVLVVDFGRFILGGAMAPAAPRMEEVMLESAAKEVSEPGQFDVEGDVSQDRMAAEPDDAPAEEFLAEGEAPAVIAEAEVTEETLGFEIEAVEEEKISPDADLETSENIADEIVQPSPTEQPLASLTPQPQPTVEYHYIDEEYYSPPWYKKIPVFKVIELLLGLGVIGFGTAAWLKRRRY